MMANISLKLLLLTSLLCSATVLRAEVITLPDTLTITINTEIVQMDLSGSGLLPLASDPSNLLGDSIEGYGFVNSQVSFSESASLFSSSTTTIFFDFLNLTSTISSSFELFLDLELTDDDPASGRDYASGSPLSITADASKPLTSSVSGTISLDLGSGEVLLSDLIETAPQIERSLGVDVNDNGEFDSIFYSLAGLTTLVEAIDFTGVDFTAITSVGNDAFLDINGSLGVTATGLTFAGQVADTITDPPFSIDVSGPVLLTTEIDEPSGLMMMLLGLLGLTRLLRRRI